MAYFLASASLFAPLAVASFALAYAILIGVPGYALASLARPAAPRTERLALAIPCAYGIVAVCGLATALLHLPFDLPAYGVLAVPIAVAGGYALWRRREHSKEKESGETKKGSRWWLMPVGVALVQVIATILIYARETVPAGFDALSHVIWTTEIAHQHIFPIALLSTHLGGDEGGFYPPVFHALTALVLQVAPIAPYRAVVYSVVAAMTMLPFALFTYVRLATGSERVAGLATLAALSFEPLPFSVLSLALYTFAVSLLIVPALAVALCHGLGHGDRRATALAAILGIGLFYTHPTEFVTAGLLVLAVVPGLLFAAGRARVWVRAALHGIVVCAAWLVAAIPALQAVRQTMVKGAQVEINTVHDFTRPAAIHLGGTLSSYSEWIYGRNVSYLLLVAVVIGVIWCLARRRNLGLVAVGLIVFVLSIDSMSYNLLRPLYVLSFPWALLERLGPTHYWVVLPLAALGIDAAIRAAGHLSLRRKSPAFIAIAALPFVVIGLLVPFGVAAGRTAAYASARRIVAPADLDALAWLDHHAPPHTAVVNDVDMAHLSNFDAPIDAGRWMPILSDVQPLFWKLGSGPGSLADRTYVLHHIADTPLPSRAVNYIRQQDVRYVFYGADARPGATRHLSLPRLLADPQLRLVYRSDAGCREESASATAGCTGPVSYIFQLQSSARLAHSGATRVAHLAHSGATARVG